MKNNKFYSYILTLLVAGSFLSACSSTNKYITIDRTHTQKVSKNIEINYIPSIDVITKDQKLLSLIKADLNKGFKIASPEFSVLKLFIETSLVADPLAKPQVKLVGILKKQENKYNYKVNYKLVDGMGNTITKGDIIGLSDEATQTISNAPALANRSAVEDAAKQVVEEINKELKNVLIDFKVVSISGHGVFVAINKDIKLSPEDIFLVNELPNTALRLNEVIESVDHNLAELKVITGQFPEVGMTINLQK
ncbi:MAG TPA: hypothetical protein DCL21_01605 [Alphaproteobacteria bacterium]|nr:hypothetical protein [Alphaproteobacteria bacterium]